MMRLVQWFGVTRAYSVSVKLPNYCVRIRSFVIFCEAITASVPEGGVAAAYGCLSSHALAP